MERETVCLLEMPEWGGDLPSINFVTPKSPDLKSWHYFKIFNEPQTSETSNPGNALSISIRKCYGEQRREGEARHVFLHKNSTLAFWKGSLGAFHALGWHQRHTAGIPISLK